MNDDDFKPKIKKIDFSFYHPADHRFWQCRTRNRHQPIYGRTFVHLMYYVMFVRGGFIPLAPVRFFATRWFDKKIREQVRREEKLDD